MDLPVGWNASAAGWVEAQGESGDWLRRWVLDPVMLELSEGANRVLDVGCGEGRFCRILANRGADVVGIDPTEALLSIAREKLPSGLFLRGYAEALPFTSGCFDMVVSYISLVDIDDYRTAIAEMARVLEPGGRLLVATLTPFLTASPGWAVDEHGRKMFFPMDDYSWEAARLVEWSGVRVYNYHRPLSAYMSSFLSNGLILKRYLEPAPIPGAPAQQALDYVRAPHGTVMLWEAPDR